MEFILFEPLNLLPSTLDANGRGSGSHLGTGTGGQGGANNGAGGGGYLLMLAKDEGAAERVRALR